jgi:ribosomal protein S6
MKNYRLVLLVKSGLKKDEKEKLTKVVTSWIGKCDQEKVQDLGERKLAYPIKSNKTAEYVVLNFAAEALAADLDKRLVMEENILRHLMIKD